MSWLITQKSKVGNTQYFLSKYNTTLNTNSNDNTNSDKLNTIGYNNGIITYKVLNFNVSLTVSLECSNDGINFFKLKTNDHASTTNTNKAEYFDWNVPVSFIRLNIVTGGTTTIGNICLNCTSSGTGVTGNIGGGTVTGTVIDLDGAKIVFDSDLQQIKFEIDDNVVGMFT